MREVSCLHLVGVLESVSVRWRWREEGSVKKYFIQNELLLLLYGRRGWPLGRLVSRSEDGPPYHPYPASTDTMPITPPNKFPQTTNHPR
jgi:hypothetical protein